MKLKTIIGGLSEDKREPEERPFPPELIEWAIAEYHRPKMLHIEVSRSFFRAVKNNPGKLRLKVVDEKGVEWCEYHRQRLPGEDKLGTHGYDVIEVLRKD